jgi:hypothetical protein
VIVRLISGVDYRGARNPQFSILPLLTDCHVFVGLLSYLYGYMNIALEQTEEHVNGAVTNRYGDAFIRGNNGAFDSFISAQAPFLNIRCICLEYSPSFDSCTAIFHFAFDPKLIALFQYYTSRRPKPYNTFIIRKLIEMEERM